MIHFVAVKKNYSFANITNYYPSQWLPIGKIPEIIIKYHNQTSKDDIYSINDESVITTSGVTGLSL